VTAEVVAGTRFQDGVGEGGNGTDGAAKNATTDDPYQRADLVARQLPVQIGDPGQMLQRVNEIEQVGELEALSGP
jgi:hypothetical protein